VPRERRGLIRIREAVRRPRRPFLARLGDLDQAALRALRTRGHGPVPDAVMKALGAVGEWGAVWAVTGLAAAALDGSRRPRWIAAATVGPAAIGLNFAIKVAVGRRRPLIEEHPPLARAPTKLSFPSAHATSSLAAATAMGRIAPAGRPALYGLAAAICLSRPYLGMHYPSDVLAGAALGTALGRLVPGLDGDRPAAAAVGVASKS
jgi:membrane-associated phospholipid phosphatase